MLLRFIDSFKVYTDKRFLLVFFLGLASGLPFNLVAVKSTFGYWLSYSNVPLSLIGLSSLIALPYSFKFLWAPFIDLYKIPFLSNRLGNKRAWAILFQIGLFCSIFSLGFVNPAENFTLMMVVIFCIAFFSASQDIVIYSFRIKILDDNQQGAGISVTTIGYRVGLYISSGIALFLVDGIGWNKVFIYTAFVSLIGIITILFSPKGKDEEGSSEQNKEPSKKSFFDPFIDFMQKDYWLLLLVFILFFRLGNSVLAVMVPAFYVDTGFSSVEVAYVSRTIGAMVTLFGGIIGGALIYKIKNIFSALFVIGILEVLTSVAFVGFSAIGYNIPVFIAVTVFDNIVAGIGGIFVINFLIKLCSSEYTTTQYAFLISVTSLSRDIVSSFSGFIADYLGWFNFFVFDAIIMLPGIFLLLLLKKVRPDI